MKKTNIILIVSIALMLSGCATYQGCRALKQFYPKEKSCSSGYLELHTSSDADCADEKQIQEIKDTCGWLF